MDTNAFRLDGKVAWITGGSYGIGFAIASAYAQMGAKIVFNDLNEEKMKMGTRKSASMLEALSVMSPKKIRLSLLLTKSSRNSAILISWLTTLVLSSVFQ